MKRIKVRLYIIILFLLFMLFLPNYQKASANSEVSVDSFLRELSEKSRVLTDFDTLDREQIVINMERLGIIMENDFEDFSQKITRQECALIIGRYLMYKGETVDQTLCDTIVSKDRLSDYSKVNNKYKEYVLYAFSAGIMTGDSNGYGIQSRKFVPKAIMTETEISDTITALLDTKKRRSFSSDGQLIRTTDLPINFEDFPYILETYPNAFYEKKFEFMLYGSEDKWIKKLSVYKIKKSVSYDIFIDREGNEWYHTNSKPMNPFYSYLTPTMLKYDAAFGCANKKIYGYYFTYTANLYNYFKDDWCKVISDFLTLKYNVNYKTIDNSWAESIDKLASNINISFKLNSKDYVKRAINNKTIIESKVISVEQSTYYEGDFRFIRAYVKFRVTSGNYLYENDIFYEPVPYDKDFTKKGGKIILNKWYTVYIDVPIGGRSAIFWRYPRYDDFITPQYVFYSGYSDTMEMSSLKMEAPLSGYTQRSKKLLYETYYYWELK